MKIFSTLFLFAVLSLSAFQNHAANYYWIGGTGNYSDTQHWAAVSGGSPAFAVAPLDTDDVFFDVNSFTAPNDTVFFDLDYNYFNSLTISGVLNTPTFIDGSLAISLIADSSVTLDPAINWQSACVLHFSTQTSCTLNTNGVFLTNEVWLNTGISSTLTLANDLHCDRFELNTGILDMASYDLHCTQSFVFWAGDIIGVGDTITSGFQMDFLYTSTLPMDGITFISPNFNVNSGIYGQHFGTVVAPYVSSDSCYFQRIYSPALIGMGNTVGLLSSDSILVDYGVDLLPPNQIERVAAGRYAFFHSSVVVDTLTFSQTGAYLVIVDTLTVNSAFEMPATVSQPGAIDYDVDPAWLNKASGFVCLDFVFIGSIHAIGGAQFFAGYNSSNDGNSTGWQFTGCVTNGGVWPGDANYDLTVNNLDILAIGVANGGSGAVRAGASLNFIEQPCASWADTLPSGVNFKHADCDGNGIVDPVDTAGVSLNYGLTHPASRIYIPESNSSTVSFLTLSVSPDTVGPSTQVHVDVDLSLDSIYGIAFSVLYDPALVNPGTFITDFSNSWLGTAGNNMIGFTKNIPAEGRIDFALVRTDHNDAQGGTGHLASFDFVIADQIPASAELSLQVVDASGIYLGGHYEPLDGIGDSTFVDSILDRMVVSSEGEIACYVTDESLDLTFTTGHSEKIRFMLTDVAGRTLAVSELIAVRGINNYILRTGLLAADVYFVQLVTPRGVLSKKVVKQ